MRTPSGVPTKLTGTGTWTGLLEIIARELTVVCLPDAIPAQLDVDVEELHLNPNVTVKDITLGEGVSIVEDESNVLAVVSAPKVEEAPVEEGEEEVAEGEEGATPAEGAEAPAAETEG